MTSRIAAWLLGSVVLAGSAAAQEVSHEVHESYDFSKAETYSWTDGQRVESELSHQRIMRSIEYELAMKGYVKIDEGEADWVIAYHGSAGEVTQVNSHYWGTRFGGGLGGPAVWPPSTVLKGTLVVDIWNVETEEVVWRGKATDTISRKPKKNEKKIGNAVTKMFAEFPPPPPGG